MTLRDLLEDLNLVSNLKQRTSTVSLVVRKYVERAGLTISSRPSMSCKGEALRQCRTPQLDLRPSWTHLLRDYLRAETKSIVREFSLPVVRSRYAPCKHSTEGGGGGEGSTDGQPWLDLPRQHAQLLTHLSSPNMDSLLDDSVSSRSERLAGLVLSRRGDQGGKAADARQQRGEGAKDGGEESAWLLTLLARDDLSSWVDGPDRVRSEVSTWC